MIEVLLSLDDGRSFSLSSQLGDGASTHGLSLFPAPQNPLLLKGPTAGIFRTREIVELPMGRMQVLELRPGAVNCVVEVLLKIESAVIRILSGEVYEREGNRFEIVEGDESILIQVDGKKPSVLVEA